MPLKQLKSKTLTFYITDEILAAFRKSEPFKLARLLNLGISGPLPLPLESCSLGVARTGEPLPGEMKMTQQNVDQWFVGQQWLQALEQECKRRGLSGPPKQFPYWERPDFKD
jgi:hypothetical protein